MNTRLVVYRPTLTDSGVVINNPSATYPVSDSETIIQVDGVDATISGLVAFSTLVDNAGVEYGIVKSVDNATTITLYNVTTAIPDNAKLFFKPEKPYDLDLQEAPNIRINLNWLDIKEPDQRRSNFSQTIKVPFTNENNTFFENWFDVNLDTLIYNTRKKFKAVILVDSVPQLEGYIQLKSIFLNSRLYEVVVFGDTANFFADIKGKKLREAFIDDNGVLDRQLDHKLTLTNVRDSWTTGLTTVLSTTENDILYPIIDYGHTDLPLCDSMFWNPDYLDPNNENNEVGNESFFQDNINYYGLITASNLKPAIRIQRLLKIIAEKAGYSITSTFLGLDGNTQDKTTFFGRQFMTLAPQYERTRVKVFEGFSASTSNTVGELFGYYQASTSFQYNLLLQPIEFDSIDYNTNSILNNTNALGQTVPTLYVPFDPDSGNEIPFGSMTLQANFTLVLPETTVAGTTIQSFNVTQSWMATYNMPITSQTVNVNPGSGVEVEFTLSINITQFINYSPYMELVIAPVFETGNLGNGLFVAGYTSASLQTINLGEGVYNNGNINGEVTMEHNMPDINQSDFVKDLCSRYNLIVTTNPSDSKNLIIEPYQSFIADGTTKYWTDKLDVSKEQVIRSTNEMQKRTLLFSDLENHDYLNKSYTDKWDRVYGSIEQINNNDFAKGDFKNHSIFAPFIAQGIGHWQYNMQGMSPNEQVAIGYTFEVDDNGEKHPINDGKPMLFYYSGTPIDLVDLNDQWGNDYEFNLLSGTYSMLGETEALDVNNKFPLCTQYDISSIGSGITTSTKVLHWEYYNPTFITNFTFNIFGDNQTEHGFYNDYWASYINEIYSDEARIMECNLHLNEDDIANFSFKNPIYIKNTLWRVLSIDSYVVGGNETTRVKLIKAISKLNYDCQYIPSTSLASGQITFTNINTGVTSVNVTYECCKEASQINFWQQTNNNLGLGICYWGMQVGGGNGGGFNGGGAGGGGVVNNGQGQGGQIPTNPPIALPMLPIQNSNTEIIRRGSTIQSQESTFYLECVTSGSTIENLRQQNINDRIINLPPNSMAYINVELTGNIIGGTGGNVGKVGFFEYYSVLVSPASQEKRSAGSTSQYKDKEQRDNDFPEPTVNISTFDSDNSLKLTITHSGNNTTSWLAKVKLLITSTIPNNEPIGERAIFQNGSGILYQDLGFLLWN